MFFTMYFAEEYRHKKQPLAREFTLDWSNYHGGDDDEAERKTTGAGSIVLYGIFRCWNCVFVCGDGSYVLQPMHLRPERMGMVNAPYCAIWSRGEIRGIHGQHNVGWLSS